MTIECPDKAVITIATGKPIYLKMAVNLARSFNLWHSDSSTQFYLATDRQDLIPADLQDINIIELQSEQSSQGFCSKLYLDTLAPGKRNLFIDADCLCYGNLDFAFERFKGHRVSAIGTPRTEGDFFGDIEQMCVRFEVPEIPVFVGSIYYLEKGDVCDRIFATARELKSKYDECGLVRLRNKPNEEPLIAISMAIHDQKAIEHDGAIKADLMYFESNFEANMFQGITSLTVSQGVQPSLSFQKSAPAIIHYNDNFIDLPEYISSSVFLEKIMLNGWSRWRAKTYSDILHILIRQYQTSIKKAKDSFRFIYRRFFGYRKIKENVRIQNSKI